MKEDEKGKNMEYIIQFIFTLFFFIIYDFIYFVLVKETNS